jgi:hypothetical protein
MWGAFLRSHELPHKPAVMRHGVGTINTTVNRKSGYAKNQSLAEPARGNRMQGKNLA